MTTGMTDPAWDALPAATPLLRRYPIAPLTAEVRALRAREWKPQRSVGQQGMIRKSTVDWKILALRSPGGDPQRTDAGGAGLLDHQATPYLSRAPYLSGMLAEFPAPLLAVRLMALGPAARVKVHRDGKCGLPWGLVRLHVPVITNPLALVDIDEQPYHWDAGQLWFGDFNRPHSVRNDGTEARIHLVLDALVTRELLELFPPEILAKLPRDEVLLTRPTVVLSDQQRAALCCRFRMPTRFCEWSEETPVAGPGQTVPAEVAMSGGRLVLVVSGQPTFGLIHLGAAEFRLAGWSEERTVRLALDGPTPTVTFLVRQGASVTTATRPAEPLGPR